MQLLVDNILLFLSCGIITIWLKLKSIVIVKLEVLFLTSRTLSKEKIVATATSLINNQESLSFTKLGKELGTRSQAIYNYFPDVMAIKVAAAASFYDQLAIRLQADLLGLSGKQAIKTFANTSVHYSLCKFHVTQEILSIPAGRLHDSDLDKSFETLHTILGRLLNPFIEDDRQRLIVSRMIRSLIIGEIIHVGNGRFDDELISSHDSFDKMLDITLADL